MGGLTMLSALWRRSLRAYRRLTSLRRPDKSKRPVWVEQLEDRTLLDVSIGGAPLSSPEGTAIPLQGIVNGSTTGLTYNWRAARGVSRNALQFDGLNDRIQVNRQVQDDFTIEAWIKTTASRSGTNFFDGLGLIWADIPGVANDFGISILNNKLAFGVGKPDRTLQSVTPVTSGEWVHIAVTRVKSTGQMKIFINGSLDATLSASPTFTINTSSLSASNFITIGGNVTDNRYFNGVIDDVR